MHLTKERMYKDYKIAYNSWEKYWYIFRKSGAQEGSASTLPLAKKKVDGWVK